MIGELTPVVLIPRFSTYLGAESFSTAPLEVSSYASGTVTLWRGPLLGTSSPTFKLYLESSHDAVTWFLPPPASVGYDPGSDASMILYLGFPHRWFRVRVTLTGTDPAVTCWCMGSLEFRVKE